jgi:DNA-binding transcriptional LysR family regulator
MRGALRCHFLPKASSLAVRHRAVIRRAGRLLTGNDHALGLGACVASGWLVAQDVAEGRLVTLAPAWRAAPLPVYIAYPQARFYPSRLLRFVAAMRAAVPSATGSSVV